MFRNGNSFLPYAAAEHNWIIPDTLGEHAKEYECMNIETREPIRIQVYIKKNAKKRACFGFCSVFDCWYMHFLFAFGNFFYIEVKKDTHVLSD